MPSNKRCETCYFGLPNVFDSYQKAPCFSCRWNPMTKKNDHWRESHANIAQKSAALFSPAEIQMDHEWGDTKSSE